MEDNIFEWNPFDDALHTVFLTRFNYIVVSEKKWKDLEKLIFSWLGGHIFTWWSQYTRLGGQMEMARNDIWVSHAMDWIEHKKIVELPLDSTLWYSRDEGSLNNESMLVYTTCGQAFLHK
jgi:hypothetical protein